MPGSSRTEPFFTRSVRRRGTALTPVEARGASCWWRWRPSSVRLPALPLWELSLAAWLIIFFVWTSLFAMVLAAATGERGLALRGSGINKVVFTLYLVGGVAMFPAVGMLIVGLLRAL